MNHLRIAILYQRGYFYYIPPSEGVHQCGDTSLEVKHCVYTLAEGSVQAALQTAESFQPDIALIYRPDYVPVGPFLQNAFVVGLSSEILPRLYEGVLHCEDKDLKCLGELLAGDLRGYDALLHHDAYSLPILHAAAEIPTHFHPLTLSENLYDQKAVSESPANKEYDIVFVGHINQRRQAFLGEIKSHFSCLSIDSGVYNLDQLARISALGRLNLNLHANYGITREIRVPLLLQLGHTVLSEALYADSYYQHPNALNFDIETIGDVVADTLRSLPSLDQRCASNWNSFAPQWSSDRLLASVLEQFKHHTKAEQGADKDDWLTQTGKRLKLAIGIRDFYTAKTMVRACLR